MRLLNSFTRDAPVVGVGELARQHALPRATVFRLAHTLEAMGYLQRVDGTKHYRLGPAILGIGFEYLASLELPEIARPALERLRDLTGASSHLAIRDGAEVVYVSRFASRSALTSNIRVGSRLAAHASTMGRVLLAGLTEPELAALYDGRELARFTEQTPVDLEQLRNIVRRDRKRGYAASRSFYERGVVSVAAPVHDATGSVVAAINITAAEQSLDLAALDGVIKDQVLEASRAISSWLGAGLSTRTAAE